MSVLQTVELPTIPIEQFSKHDDTSVLNRKDASGIGGGGMLFGGGGRLTSLDDNMSLMASVGGSVHNFQIDGAVDESRYLLSVYFFYLWEVWVQRINQNLVRRCYLRRLVP